MAIVLGLLLLTIAGIVKVLIDLHSIRKMERYDWTFKDEYK